MTQNPSIAEAAQVEAEGEESSLEYCDEFPVPAAPFEATDANTQRYLNKSPVHPVRWHPILSNYRHQANETVASRGMKNAAPKLTHDRLRFEVHCIPAAQQDLRQNKANHARAGFRQFRDGPVEDDTNVSLRTTTKNTNTSTSSDMSWTGSWSSSLLEGERFLMKRWEMKAILVIC